MSSLSPICVRCNKPVILNVEFYETFERMHWLCFHLEYEHDADPDEPCNDISSCPWHRIKCLGDELRKLGRDPDELIPNTLRERV